MTPVGEPELEHATDSTHKLGEIESFLLDRLLQINPKASEQKIKEVFDAKFGPNSVMYIYGHRSGEPSGQDTDTYDGAFDYFAISPSPPPWADQNEINTERANQIWADGRIREYINKNRYSFFQVGSGWHNNLGFVGVDQWPPPKYTN